MKGFTLIELMVIIAIVGILASVGAGFFTGVNLEQGNVEIGRVEKDCDGKHVYGNGNCE